MKGSFCLLRVRWVLLSACLRLFLPDETWAALGTVVAWGNNQYGQSTVPTNLSGVVAIAAGGYHSLALMVDGHLIAWGNNSSGQVRVPATLSGVTAIAAGGAHSLALKGDGTVVAWGLNIEGQSTVPTNLSGVIAVAAGASHSLALKGDGKVVAWGYNGQGQGTVPNLGRVVAIAAGGYYNLALTADGTVVGWGNNANGESTVPTNLSAVAAIAAGGFHSLGLKGDGTVIAWGLAAFGESTVPANLSGAVAVAAGYYHSLAIKGDRTMAAWGDNSSSQTAVPTNLTRVGAIAAGGYHNLALVDDTILSLLRQPANQTVVVGATVVFEVAASGTPPLLYQWRKDSANLIAQTNSVLTLHNAQPTDSGDYSVVVTDLSGSVTSQVARLTVGYSLSVQVSGMGIVSVSPNQTILDPDSTVTLTASAPLNNEFVSWSGDASGNQNPLTFTMDRNKSVTASFLPTYTIATATNGNGSVAVTPLKVRYLTGEVVQIAATPARWYAFSRWSDGVTANPRSITVASNASFTAVFVPPTPLETLTYGGVSRSAPVGMPAVFVDGVFTVETNISKRGSATVALLSTFTNGTLLSTLDGSKPDFSAKFYEGPFLVKKPATLRAVAYNADFTQAVPSDPLEIVILPTLTTSTEGGGSVTIDPPAGAYFSNGTAVVTARPAAGWTFLQWLGDATGTNPTVTVTMSRNKCVQAVFGTSVSNTVVGNGLIVRRPSSALYPYGSTVRFTAVPIGSNYFALWGNAASSGNNPLTFTVSNANPTVTAVFAALGGGSVALVVTPNGSGEVNISPRANRYNSGAMVTLTAVPEAGQSFLDWSGSISGTNNPLMVTMDQGRLITANFSKRPRLSVPGCGGWFDDGEMQLRLTGELGDQYWIVAATNLVPGATVWTPIGLVTNSFGVAQFNDALVTHRPHRFYRAAEMVPVP